MVYSMHKTLEQFFQWLDGNAAQPSKEETASLGPVTGPDAEEFFKKLLAHPRRVDGVRMLVECGLSRAVMPELDSLVGVPQPPEFHPEGDCFVHTVLALEKLKPDASFELALAVLLHDIGKPRTFSETDRIHFYGHEALGGRMARKICMRMGMAKDAVERVARLVALHMQIKDVSRMGIKKLTRFVRTDYFRDMVEVARADCASSHGDLSPVEYAEKKAEEIGPEPPPPPPPLVTGTDLIEMGYEPGPIFGRILRRIEELRAQEKVGTREDALDAVTKEFPL